MISKSVIFTLLVLLFPISVQAQTDSEKTVLYVTDELRLSLYEQSNAQSDVIIYLGSGDKLVVEETAGAYAKVTTPSGNVGWVKRGFLVSEPTSKLLLAGMTETNDLLKKELEKLSNSKLVLDQYETDMNAMSTKIESLEQQKQSAEATIADLKQAAEARSRAEKSRPALAMLKKIAMAYWQYLVLALAVFLLVGYLIGKRITETAVKRKFHGIKVW